MQSYGGTPTGQSTECLIIALGVTECDMSLTPFLKSANEGQGLCVI